jgi:hypothetical protein
MKKCTYCGQEYPDNATVCAIDRQPLAPLGQSAPTPDQPKASVTPAVKPPMMVRLRTLHLYLGCIFAPMLLLFALTGIWQTIGIGGAKWMEILSAIHMSRGSKGGPNLTTPLLMAFIVLMAVAFIFTTLLGVLMAVKQSRYRRDAYYCLAFGVLFPLLAILIHVFR